MCIEWVYIAWIQNLQFPDNDQDCEYPCVIIIKAIHEKEAKKWGDTLYQEALLGEKTHKFLWSEVHGQNEHRYESNKLFNSKKPPDWMDTPQCLISQKLVSELLF